MKTFEEYLKRLQNDEEFAKEIGEAFKAKAEAGETDYNKMVIEIAAEKGYTITEEEIEAFSAEAKESLSEEELGKVAGGSTPVCGVLGTLASLFVTSMFMPKS